MDIIEDKTTTFHYFFKLFWYLLTTDLKSYSITLSASLLILISMLSVVECIIRSSSLSSSEKIKPIVIHWILELSDILRLFMISFNDALILLK